MRSLVLTLRQRLRLGFLRQLAPHVGVLGALALRFVEDWNNVAISVCPSWRVGEVKVRPKGYDTSVAIRVGSSDFRVFEQIFIRQQYSPATSIKDPKVIVDCGANAGYSALFFLKHFPRARVIAVEPDALNADLCRRNVRSYGDRVVVIEKAIWGSVTKLGFLDETRKPGEEWGIQVRAMASNTTHTVEAIDIPHLMAMTGVEEIDLLKIDIEKSEADVFRSDPDAWLNRVRNIAIELHGRECSDIFHSALRDFSFRGEQSGEVTLCLGIRACMNGLLAAVESSE